MEIGSNDIEITELSSSVDDQKKDNEPATVVMTDWSDTNLKPPLNTSSIDPLETDDVTSICDFSQYLDLTLENPSQPFDHPHSPADADLNMIFDLGQGDLLQDMESICSLQLPHVGPISSKEFDQNCDLSSLFQLSDQDKSHTLLTIEALPQISNFTELDFNYNALSSTVMPKNSSAVIDPILTSFTSSILDDNEMQYSATTEPTCSFTDVLTPTNEAVCEPTIFKASLAPSNQTVVFDQLLESVLNKDVYGDESLQVGTVSIDELYEDLPLLY